jgi:hypothetical protein
MYYLFFCKTFVGNNIHFDKYEYLNHWIEMRTEIHVDLHEKFLCFY